MATDDLQKSQELGKEQSQLLPPINDYDPDNKSETETKSLSSVKSNGSNPDLRYKNTYTHLTRFFYFSIILFSASISFKLCFISHNCIII